MSILGQESITRRRYPSGGDYDSDGAWAESGAPTDSTIQASVQPLQGKDRELLPEGKRHADGKKIYTTTALRVDDQNNQLRGDQLVIDSVVYDVIVVKRERSVIAHYKALILRISETT